MNSKKMEIIKERNREKRIDFYFLKIDQSITKVNKKRPHQKNKEYSQTDPLAVVVTSVKLSKLVEVMVGVA